MKRKEQSKPTKKPSLVTLIQISSEKDIMYVTEGEEVDVAFKPFISKGFVSLVAESV